ncbi:hypothetical protein PoB_002563100 [Plakobranchus ocellatus]|uniref:Uncharacterized protein n=1 Tax=Plakobranchus ocellatus TaxID=259542 RepID=A0AAV3ZJ37_9GAST|nr:hypothetical protein PoB_002563100 [Plakobranchus ocellatus]
MGTEVFRLLEETALVQDTVDLLATVALWNNPFLASVETTFVRVVVQSVAKQLRGLVCYKKSKVGPTLNPSIEEPGVGSGVFLAYGIMPPLLSPDLKRPGYPFSAGWT